MKIRSLIVAAAICLSHVGTSNAGLYTDDLSRCIVESTTPEDKTNLMKWMFIAISQHPSVSGLSSVKHSDIDEANRTIGQLITRLLTEKCKQKAQDAIRIEGPAAIQASFEVLGRVASVGLFSDPNVAKAIAGISKYSDKKKLEELSKPVQQK